jgi:hypothetical protein
MIFFVSQMCNTWISLSQTVNCNAIVIPNDTVLAGVDDLLKVLGRDSLILQACLLKGHNWIWRRSCWETALLHVTHMLCHVHYSLSFLQQAKHVRFLTANHWCVNITFTHDYLSHCKSLYIDHKLTTWLIPPQWCSVTYVVNPSTQQPTSVLATSCPHRTMSRTSLVNWPPASLPFSANPPTMMLSDSANRSQTSCNPSTSREAPTPSQASSTTPPTT